MWKVDYCKVEHTQTNNTVWMVQPTTQEIQHAPWPMADDRLLISTNINLQLTYLAGDTRALQ